MKHTGKGFFNPLFLLKNEQKSCPYILRLESKNTAIFFFHVLEEKMNWSIYPSWFFWPLIILRTEFMCLDPTRSTVWHKKYSKYQLDKLYTSIYSITLHQRLIPIFEDPKIGFGKSALPPDKILSKSISLLLWGKSGHSPV